MYYSEVLQVKMEELHCFHFLRVEPAVKIGAVLGEEVRLVAAVGKAESVRFLGFGFLGKADEQFESAVVGSELVASLSESSEAAETESAESAALSEEEESELVVAAVEESVVDSAALPAVVVDCELELVESVVAAEGSALSGVAVVAVVGGESVLVESAAVAELKEFVVVEASVLEPELAVDSGFLESEAAVKELAASLAVATAFLASEALLKE